MAKQIHPLLQNIRETMRREFEDAVRGDTSTDWARLVAALNAVLLTKDTRIAALEAELAAKTAECERYLWLKNNALGFDSVADPANMVQIWCGTDPARCFYGKTLDDAIDAARKEGA